MSRLGFEPPTDRNCHPKDALNRSATNPYIPVRNSRTSTHWQWTSVAEFSHFSHDYHHHQRPLSRLPPSTTTSATTTNDLGDHHHHHQRQRQQQQQQQHRRRRELRWCVLDYGTPNHEHNAVDARRGWMMRWRADNKVAEEQGGKPRCVSTSLTSLISH